MKLINKRIHIIGIGGISMSAIARLLKKGGNIITGSDTNCSNITKKLEEDDIKIVYKHKRENVKNVDVVIYSAAIKKTNPELVEARKRNLLVLTRAEVLGMISEGYKNVILVSGTHGKTTTTGMIATCFLKAGLNPTIHIGGEMEEINGNLYVGSNEFFISEACEYCDSFLHFLGDSVVALNIEKDHMDYFKTFDNLKKSFNTYLKNTRNGGIAIINADDENLCNLTTFNNVFYFGINNKNANLLAKHIKMHTNSVYSFDLFLNNVKINRIKLNIPGKHQIYNALACISVCFQYKIDINIVKNALFSYKGIKRRFEFVGCVNGAKVIHDYAHHPTEILKNIELVRSCVKGRVIVVFQPHTYSRTKELMSEFVEVLSKADIVYLYKIYPAREKPILGVTSNVLSHMINSSGTFSLYFNNFNDIYSKLKNVVNNNDIVLILGAGDIVNLCNLI